MEFIEREQAINELQQSFQSYIERFDIDDIGIFEEEGPEGQYYLGYTVKKNGKAYHIHTPYMKNNTGDLTPISTEWTVESDNSKKEDRRGYTDLESVFQEL